MSMYNWRLASIPYASPESPTGYDRDAAWDEWCAEEDAKGDEERYYDDNL